MTTPQSRDSIGSASMKSNSPNKKPNSQSQTNNKDLTMPLLQSPSPEVTNVHQSSGNKKLSPIQETNSNANSSKKSTVEWAQVESDNGKQWEMNWKSSSWNGNSVVNINSSTKKQKRSSSSWQKWKSSQQSSPNKWSWGQQSASKNDNINIKRSRSNSTDIVIASDNMWHFNGQQEYVLAQNTDQIRGHNQQSQRSLRKSNIKKGNSSTSVRVSSSTSKSKQNSNWNLSRQSSRLQLPYNWKGQELHFWQYESPNKWSRIWQDDSDYDYDDHDGRQSYNNLSSGLNLKPPSNLAKELCKISLYWVAILMFLYVDYTVIVNFYEENYGDFTYTKTKTSTLKKGNEVGGATGSNTSGSGVIPSPPSTKEAKSTPTEHDNERESQESGAFSSPKTSISKQWEKHDETRWQIKKEVKEANTDSQNKKQSDQSKSTAQSSNEKDQQTDNSNSKSHNGKKQDSQETKDSMKGGNHHDEESKISSKHQSPDAKDRGEKKNIDQDQDEKKDRSSNNNKTKDKTHDEGSDDSSKGSQKTNSKDADGIKRKGHDHDDERLRGKEKVELDMDSNKQTSKRDSESKKSEEDMNQNKDLEDSDSQSLKHENLSKNAKPGESKSETESRGEQKTTSIEKGQTSKIKQQTEHSATSFQNNWRTNDFDSKSQQQMLQNEEWKKWNKMPDKVQQVKKLKVDQADSHRDQINILRYGVGQSDSDNIIRETNDRIKSDNHLSGSSNDKDKENWKNTDQAMRRSDPDGWFKVHTKQQDDRSGSAGDGSTEHERYWQSPGGGVDNGKANEKSRWQYEDTEVEDADDKWQKASASDAKQQQSSASSNVVRPASGSATSTSAITKTKFRLRSRNRPTADSPPLDGQGKDRERDDTKEDENVKTKKANSDADQIHADNYKEAESQTVDQGTHNEDEDAELTQRKQNDYQSSRERQSAAGKALQEIENLLGKL